MSLKTVSVAPGGGGSGNGTVTNVSITTANGVSGAVANSTTTPAITLTLGDITPTKVTVTESVGSSALVLTGATQTASFPVLNATQTWSNSSATFTAVKLNVTDSNSAAASLLMDLQVAGTSKFSVKKDGSVSTGAWQGTAVGVAYGGTGQTTASTGDLIVGNGTNSLTRLGIGSTGQVLTVSGGTAAWAAGASGTVTSVSVTTANGVSGTVANATTTSAISLSLGDITPTSVALNGDTYLTRKVAANLRHGQADAASPIAQTLSVQSVVAGTTGNVAGQPFTIAGSQGVGSGAGGSIIFQVAPAGSTATFTVTFTNGSATINGTGLPTTAGTAVAFTTTGSLPTNFAINTTYFVLAGSTSTAITVAATAGGTAIVAGSAGSGTQTLTQAVAQNALSTALTIAGDRSITIPGDLSLFRANVSNNIYFTSNQNGVNFGFSGNFGSLNGISSNVLRFWDGSYTSAPLIQLGGGTSSFPAIKRSSTTIQSRLADDSGFASVQGKLTTDNAYTAGTVVQTGYVTIYDSTGTAYKVLVGT
jgi:hypothetical protein